MQPNSKSTEASTNGQSSNDIGASSGMHDFFSGFGEVDVDKLLGGSAFLPELGSPRFDYNPTRSNANVNHQPAAAAPLQSSSASVSKPTAASRPDLHQIFAFMMAIDQRMSNLESIVASSFDTGYAAMQMAPMPMPQVRHTDNNYIPSMRDLDQVCNPEFAKEPSPTTSDLNRMYQALEGQFPTAGRRNILSAVRKWYRKKRDENGQKVFTSCLAVIQPLLNDGLSIEDIKARLEDPNDGLLQRMLNETNLDIKDSERAQDFLHKKIEAYFQRRVLNH